MLSSISLQAQCHMLPLVCLGNGRDHALNCHCRWPILQLTWHRAHCPRRLGSCGYLTVGNYTLHLSDFSMLSQAMGHVFTLPGFKPQHFLGSFLTSHQISDQELLLLPSEGFLHPTSPSHSHSHRLLCPPLPLRHLDTCRVQRGAIPVLLPLVRPLDFGLVLFCLVFQWQKKQTI